MTRKAGSVDPSGGDALLDNERYGFAGKPFGGDAAMPIDRPEDRAMTPAHDHLGDVFATLDAQAFQRCFVAWVAALTKTSAEFIAIDGKTLRRSYQKKGSKEPIHMVLAFAARQRLVMGQVAVVEKSNEIVAIPALLDMGAVTMKASKPIGSKGRCAGRPDSGADACFCRDPRHHMPDGAVFSGRIHRKDKQDGMAVGCVEKPLLRT